MSAGFQGNKSVTFAYQNVLEDHVALDRLDQYLSTATVKPDENVVRQALTNDNAFVLTSTIKSKQITVTAQADNDIKGKVNAPVVQQVASGNLSVGVSRANQGQVTFTGNVPVIFGFKAVQIFTDQNAKFTVFKPVADGSVVLRRLAQVTDQDLSILDLNGQGVFFEFTDGPGEQAVAETTGAGAR